VGELSMNVEEWKNVKASDEDNWHYGIESPS
jgi:hypothetical protein